MIQCQSHYANKRRTTLWIYFTRQFQAIRVCEIGVGSRDSKDDGVWFCNVLEDHVLDLLFNVFGLVADGYFGETRKIDEGEGEDIGGEDAEVDGDRRDAGVLAGLGVCFADDFISYLGKVVKLLVWEVEELAPLVSVVCVIALFIDLDTVCSV
jgi:hypothetical protein